MTERWWLDREGAALLAGLGLGSGAALAAAAARGRVVSTGRSAAAVVVEGKHPLLLKWRRCRPDRRRRTFLRSSPERLEARASLRAAALGIPAPLPLAVVEIRRLGLLEGAVLLRRYLPGGCTAAEAFRDSTWREAWERAARALEEWHRRGFRHGDCWPRNILLAREIVPIGYSRARFLRGGERRDRRRVDDCARLLFGLGRIRPEADEESTDLLEVYSQDPALLRAILHRKEHLARRRKKGSLDRPPEVPPFPQLAGYDPRRDQGRIR